MKNLILLPALVYSLSSFVQAQYTMNDFFPSETNQRIVQSQYYEVSEEPQYRLEYSYSRKGLLSTIKKKEYVNNAWMAQLTQKYEYDLNTGMITCEYVPSITGDGALDFDKMMELKKAPKEKDTLFVKAGKITYLSQFRKMQYNDYLYLFYFEYEGDKLVSSIKKSRTYLETKQGMKLSKPSELWKLTFTYEGDKLTGILQENSGFTRRWELKYNASGLVKMDVYDVKDGGEELKIEYEVESENGKIIALKNNMVMGERRMLVESRKYEYNNNGMLVLSYLFSDSGGKKYEYSYEEGNGNAELFFEKKSVYDFIKPMIE